MKQSRRQPNPEAWSDFDGTAVRKHGLHDPRNWLKYPLRGLPQYPDFMRGLASVGVEMPGTVTRRSEKWRKTVTHRSISEHEYTEFFPTREHVVFAGSEAAKAQFIVDRSRKRTVGLIEDRPHNVGAEIVGILSADPEIEARIMIGAVDCKKRAQYLHELEPVSESMDAIVKTSEFGDLSIVVGASVVEVVCLEPYSYAAGESFGNQLIEFANSA